MGSSIQVLALCSFHLFVISEAVYQRWQANTNFENPNNWNVKRAPCGNDRVVIPNESPVVYMQINTTIQELILPMSGEIVLGSNANLGFTQDPAPESDCPSAGEEVEFTATFPVPWLNPSSWCVTGTRQGACDYATPMLDVERVPCSYDDVILPKNESYFVKLPSVIPNIEVKTLAIFGSPVTTSSFSTFLDTDLGKRVFSMPDHPSNATRISISKKACDDKRGCACGNDQPKILKEICSHVEKTCSRPKCKDMIQPIGACCRMCGAVLTITPGYGYDHQAFIARIKNIFYTNETKDGINMTIFLAYNGKTQIALSDETGGKSARLAKQIQNEIGDDMDNGGQKYAVRGVVLATSMFPSLGPSSHTGELSGGSVAGIVIGLIIVLVILVLVTVYFVFKRTGREIPKMPTIPLPSVSMPQLPRLPRRTPKATARVPARPHTAPHVDPGFANPLYDSSPFDDGNAVVKEMEMIATGLEEQPTFSISAGGGFNNPLYGTQAEMFDDPTKVSGASARPHKGDVTDKVATGSEKETAAVPTADTSAQMILVDISEETDSNI